ncbi:uncharacterized protein LOC134346687 isoform X5 [Mobula hypostoma]|uniref:uncharacterized protein LOC134346687 isoform X5 n=1 Tax=Mobula hypostoma TaxID=723540 RepID=UPI002FC34B73
MRGAEEMSCGGRGLSERRLCVSEREEVVSVFGSSVLLDPEITVDPSKNEILWTFKASNKSDDMILDHIPGVATLEPSERFKDRLQFNAAKGALTINRLEASDEGNYTYSVDSKELKIIQLLVIDKMKEVIGILGSSVLLDPKIKVDPNKNEILWTFIASNKSLEVVLDHIPGLTMEPSEQFKNRLQFFASSGGLMINSLKTSDQGDYIFTVDGRELKVIQLFLHDKMKEVIGILGSSVLLDPGLRVDPSKNEIVWTFFDDSILNHIPDHTTTEHSEQFKSRLEFSTSNGALTVNGLTPRDEGSYSFIVNEEEMKVLELLIYGIYRRTGKVLVLVSTTVTVLFTLLFIIFSVLVLVSAVSTNDNAAVLLAITGLVLPLMFLFPLVCLFVTLISNTALKNRKRLSLYSVIFLFITFITMFSWMVITGLTREDILMFTMSVIGLVPYAGYAITFLFWTWKGFPGIGDKRWGWFLNICNVVSLICILITFICWIVFKVERCDSNIPTWILLIALMPGCVITLLRTFLIWYYELSEGSIFTNSQSLRSTVELTCDVLGDSNVYQWQKNGGEISQHYQLTDENRTLVFFISKYTLFKNKYIQ